MKLSREPRKVVAGRTRIERGKGWPWNGYQLIQMKSAGLYPPRRENSAQSN